MKNEIICPHCQKAFKIDESGYADIVKQIRNSEFNQELDDRLELAEKEKLQSIELEKERVASKLQKEAAKKEAIIAELEGKLKAEATAQKLAVTEAISKIEKEKDDLAHQLQQIQKDNEAAAKLAEAESLKILAEEASRKDKEIDSLKAKLEQSEVTKQLAVSTALSKVEKERDQLKNDIKQVQTQNQLSEKSLTDKYEARLKDRDDAIERLKDMKARLSTKMLGETLEQHCEVAFNKIRSSAFPNAYFEKDSDTSTGSKGDYIFKESDENDSEFVSIMFEMKNESDTTATKKKNEDFFKELDKDRNEKGCEYAVLVSMLEPENEFYNEGIVDVSYRYPKMYVVRPQFFIPIITLLRNASLKTLEYKSELAKVRAQNIDITNFEDDIKAITSEMSQKYQHASDRFSEAIKWIDQAIKYLEKTKGGLLKSEKHIRLLTNKAEDLSITKLTKNNKTMTKMFDDLKSSDANLIEV